MPATLEALALIAEYQQTKSSRAGGRLLDHYDRFLHQQARQASAKYGVPFDNAMQAARLGLLEAADRFEPERGYALQPLAVARIRRQVANARAEEAGSSNTHILEARRLIAKATAALQAEGKRVSDEAIAAHLGWGVERVTSAIRRSVSMDADISADGDGVSTLHDVLADKGSRRPDRIAEERLHRKHLREMLEATIMTSLTERNAEIVMAYLEEGCEPGDQTKLAERFGVTRQRVAQAVGNAMPVLRRALELNGVKARHITGLGMDES